MATTTHIDAEAESKAAQASIVDFAAARDKLIELESDLAAEETAIAENERLYAEASRIHAGGGDADPASILADSDRRRHRIAGLLSLISGQRATMEALRGAYEAATRSLSGSARHRAIFELRARIGSAEAKAAAVKKASDDAAAELRSLREELSALRAG
jgi:hypothetical protein